MTDKLLIERELLGELRDAANEAHNEATRPNRMKFFAALVEKADAILDTPSAPKADDPVKVQLLEALEKVDSEHEILGWMKTCELRRGRGSFGIAVMSDELALDWQSHQKNLERLIGLRHAAIAAARQEGGKV